MTQKRKDWLSNHGSTILGLITAISSAWVTIDWTTFDIKRDYMKLILSGIIAIGGYKTTIKIK